MPRRVDVYVVCFVLFAHVAVLAAEAPVAVSPGRAEGLALVESRCPTFSWGAIPEAESYELLVYRVGDKGEGTRPVLQESFAGSVASWTPSLDRCLERGGRYAWSVRAGGRAKGSEWSRPSLFQVASGPNEAEFEEALALVRVYLGSTGIRPEGWLSGSIAQPLEGVENGTLNTESSGALSQEPAPTGVTTADVTGMRSEVPDSTGVVAFGIHGISASDFDNSAGVVGESTATAGATNGVLGLVDSPGGVAGAFDNTAGGPILSGRNNGVELYRVDGTGAVTASSFSGDGSALTSLDPAYLSGGTAAINVTGSAGLASDLGCTSCVAESELEFDPATQAELDAVAAAASYMAGNALELNTSTFDVVGSPVERVLVVAKSGGDFTTITAALNSISGNSANNRYQILVGPGEYSEILTMKPFVDIVGSGTQLTRITHDGGGNTQVVTTSDNSELRDLTVENNGSGSSSFALGINNNGAAPTIVNVHVNAFGGSFNYAVYNQNGAHPTLRNVIVSADGGSSAVAMYHFSSDSTSYSSSFSATDDTNGNGFYMTGGTGSYTATLVNSAVAGSQTILRLSTVYTFQAAGSQLHGGGTINLNGGTTICVASFDGNFAALNSTCS